MVRKSLCHLHIARILQSIILILFLSSCEVGRNDNGSTESMIQVHTADGLNCPPQGWSIVPQTLVLTEERLSYAKEEVQQMASYIDKAVGMFNADPEHLIKKSEPLPPTLQFMQGSLTTNIAGWSLFHETWKPGCIGYVEITNVGKEDITLLGMNARLLAPPQRNTEQYRFINICSLPITFPQELGRKCPVTPEESGKDENLTFSLEMSSSGQIFPGERITYESFEGRRKLGTRFEWKLPPHVPTILHLNFESPEFDGNLRYHIIPELVISNEKDGEERTVPLKELESHLVFADSTQVSCYSLPTRDATTFVPIEQNGVGLSLQDAMDQEAIGSAWCI